MADLLNIKFIDILENNFDKNAFHCNNSRVESALSRMADISLSYKTKQY